MSSKSKVEYFTNANRSFTDVAHMLIDLDRKRLVPDEMREAIRQHADNSLDVLPLGIAAIASTLASAAYGDFGIDESNVANASYAIAELAEQMHGWVELQCCFGPGNTLRDGEVPHG
jgi:hypothetical protein